jgi:hypothetical protein
VSCDAGAFFSPELTPDFHISSKIPWERQNSACSANDVASQGGDFMSFRNGDKSRENRLRKARQKMREKVRDLQPNKDKVQAAVATKK